MNGKMFLATFLGALSGLGTSVMLGMTGDPYACAFSGMYGSFFAHVNQPMYELLQANLNISSQWCNVLYIVPGVVFGLLVGWYAYKYSRAIQTALLWFLLSSLSFVVATWVVHSTTVIWIVEIINHTALGAVAVYTSYLAASIVGGLLLLVPKIFNTPMHSHIVWSVLVLATIVPGSLLAIIGLDEYSGLPKDTFIFILPIVWQASMFAILEHDLRENPMHMH